MHFLIGKALHIFFSITWFAGLFYIVRLFVYHAEAQTRPDPEREILQNQYKIMEKRLWKMITWPSMVLAIFCGLWVTGPYFKHLLHHPWLIVKLALVFGLVLYHLQCGAIYRQLQNNVIKHSAVKLRLFNEGAILFLLAIVFIIVLRSSLNWIWGAAGLVVITGLIIIAVRLHKKKRKASVEIDQADQ